MTRENKPQIKISDVLWLAANKYLRSESNWEYWAGWGHPCDITESFSCRAVNRAIEELYLIPSDEDESFYVFDFLEELGVNCNSSMEFREFRTTRSVSPASVGERLLATVEAELAAYERLQGARYLWLMFAYEVALSEGK